MKKLTILLWAILLPVFGCEKDELPHECAWCIEHNTGYIPDEFCGSKAAVKEYVKNLEEDGSALGQDWECKIH